MPGFVARTTDAYGERAAHSADQAGERAGQPRSEWIRAAPREQYAAADERAEEQRDLAAAQRMASTCSLRELFERHE